MLTLYEHPLSAFAMKAKIGLAEKGLEFTAIVPDGMMNGKTGGEFVEANPRAEIPTLIDGEVKIFDYHYPRISRRQMAGTPLAAYLCGRSRAGAHDRRRDGHAIRAE